jgi:hypothetical protein
MFLLKQGILAPHWKSWCRMFTPRSEISTSRNTPTAEQRLRAQRWLSMEQLESRQLLTASTVIDPVGLSGTLISTVSGSGANTFIEWTASITDKGQITIEDASVNNENLYFERTGNYLRVIDQSPYVTSEITIRNIVGARVYQDDPALEGIQPLDSSLVTLNDNGFRVVGTPPTPPKPSIREATGRVIDIPYSEITGTTKPLLVRAKQGDDIVTFDTDGVATAAQLIPTTGLSLDLGEGVDTLAMADSTLACTWTISGTGEGSLKLPSLQSADFFGTENLVGASGPDTFALENTNINSIATIDGGEKGIDENVIKVTRNVATNYVLGDTELRVNVVNETSSIKRQTFTLANIDRAELTGSTEVDSFDVSNWTKTLSENCSWRKLNNWSIL